MAFNRLTMLERISSKVEYELNTGCWLWSGSMSTKIYGGMRYRGIPSRVHRVSWIVHRGEIPTGLCVCHRCDTPLCVNPAHLFLGTRRDNNLDRTRKGRTRNGNLRGSQHGMAKLNEDQARMIRRLYASGEKQQAIADRFGVSQGTVTQIVTGKAWRVAA